MSFGNPTAFFWALLAIPIVIFYILKVRLRHVPVSSVMFWEQVFEQHESRSLWQQLRHVASLLIQLAILLLLLLAVADPLRPSDILNQRRIVVVLDNSASMQVIDNGGVTRLDVARQQIERLVQSLRPRDQLAIVCAGTRPEIQCGLTSHKRTLLDELDQIQPTDGPTVVKQAVELSNRLLGEAENGQVIVFTDGGFFGAAELAAEPSVEWSMIGQSASNVGITQFQVRRSLSDPIGYQILLEVQNFGTEVVEGTLDLSLDDNLIDVLPVTVEPRQTDRRIIDNATSDGGLLTAVFRTDGPSKANALTVDDVATAVLPQRTRIPVVLVTKGNWFLQRALEANEAVDLMVTDSIPDNVPADTVLVFHRIVPNVIPSGRVFVVQPEQSTDLWERGPVIEQPLVASQNQDHALLHHVRLDNVLMPEAFSLTPVGQYTRLAESVSGDPLYLHIARESGDVIVLPVNLDQSDLPLRTAFPIMLSNALSWLSQQSEDMQRAYATGESIQLTLPADFLPKDSDDSSVSLRDPEGSMYSVAAVNGRVAIGPLQKAGIWAVVADSGNGAADVKEISLSCNLTNAGESDLMLAEDIPSRRNETLTASGSPPIRTYLLAAAFALLLAEWGLYHRRKIA